MPRHTFENTVEPVYGLDKFGLIKLCYFDNKMSDIEIIEAIERDTGHRFSRMAIKKWRDIFSLKARNPHERFQLAVDKKRFDHKKVAQRINYKLRNLTEGYRNKSIFQKYSTKPEKVLLLRFKKEVYRRYNMITLNKELFEVICKVKGLDKNPYAQLAKDLRFTRQYISMVINEKVGVSAEFIERYVKYINEHKSNNWSRFFKIVDKVQKRR